MSISIKRNLPTQSVLSEDKNIPFPLVNVQGESAYIHMQSASVITREKGLPDPERVVESSRDT